MGIRPMLQVNPVELHVTRPRRPRRPRRLRVLDQICSCAGQASSWGVAGMNPGPLEFVFR